MRLTNVQVKNFRTFGGDHEIPIASGVNCFVGPNNCGKSNLFRAIALAMDPDAPFSRELDLPTFLLGGRPPIPRMTLTFEADPSSQPDRTLIERAEKYERSVRGPRGATFADANQIKFVVTFPGDQRVDSFAVKGKGAVTGSADAPEFRDLYAQFRKVVRFVLVRSGESLESLLQGRFRDILQLVIQDHLRAEVLRAETARTTYERALQDDLLVPLRDRVTDVVHEVFPEIASAEIIPGIPSIAQTLANVEVRLSDTATTDLYGKGTGVRGAVLAAILQYLADQTRRSMVFAVEEPEAFLHPAAQEELRTKLEKLAVRTDVTLLVTTHSPFILSRRPESQVSTLSKDARGWSRLVATAAGDDRAADVASGLFRDSALESMLTRALSVPADTRGIVVVEGYTDSAYLRLAAQLQRRPELLEGLHLVEAGGATKTVLQTVLFAASSELPVITLLDSDDIGRACKERLERFDRSTGRQLVRVTDAAGACKTHPLEAEDLWPATLVGGMLAEIGDDGYLASKVRCGASWHFALTAAGKTELLNWLPSHAAAADSAALISLLEVINARVDRLGSQKSASGMRV
mgnify:CR=1 FL=1